MPESTFFDQPWVKGFSFAVDLLTAVTFVVVTLYGSIKKNSSLLAFRIYQFCATLFKLSWISVFLLLYYLLFYQMGYGLIFTLINGSYHGGMWDEQHWLFSLLTHVLCVGISSLICIPVVTLLYTFSMRQTKIFVNHLLPAHFRFVILQEPQLNIISAEYRSANISKDVTDIVRSMIANNKLTVLASNELAGDPDPYKKKRLVIHYQYGFHQKQISVAEGMTVTLPPVSQPVNPEESATGQV